jgi:hypothetical protein
VTDDTTPKIPLQEFQQRVDTGNVEEGEYSAIVSKTNKPRRKARFSFYAQRKSRKQMRKQGPARVWLNPSYEMILSQLNPSIAQQVLFELLETMDEHNIADARANTLKKTIPYKDSVLSRSVLELEKVGCLKKVPIKYKYALVKFDGYVIPSRRRMVNPRVFQPSNVGLCNALIDLWDELP